MQRKKKNKKKIVVKFYATNSMHINLMNKYIYIYIDMHACIIVKK